MLARTRRCDVGYLEGGDSRYNIGVTEGLWLATVGGAKVVGMARKLGAFEEGMFWDVQEIELGRDVPEVVGEEVSKGQMPVCKPQ